jgi:hypothetical protein
VSVFWRFFYLLASVPVPFIYDRHGPIFALCQGLISLSSLSNVVNVLSFLVSLLSHLFEVIPCPALFTFVATPYSSTPDTVLFGGSRLFDIAASQEWAESDYLTYLGSSKAQMASKPGMCIMRRVLQRGTVTALDIQWQES